MNEYLRLLRNVRDHGIRVPNRTGIDTLMFPGAMMQFDLRLNFPAVTTKALAVRAVKGELVGFMRGCTSAEEFRDLGCNIWDANANENEAWLRNPNRKGTDDLGRIYGAQWRDWHGGEWDHSIDQLAEAVWKIMNTPNDRRIIISAWRPDEFAEMALPPCHVLYQFIVDTTNNVLHLCMYQRSCDMFLGVPFNIASASFLLAIMAKLTGYTAGMFTHFLADAHIYVNHLEQVTEQLRRMPFNPPEVEVRLDAFPAGTPKEVIASLFNTLSPNDFDLVGYKHHDAIRAPMAV